MEPSRIHAVEHVHLETVESLEDELIWFYGEVSGLELVSSWSECRSDEAPQLRFRSARIELRLHISPTEFDINLMPHIWINQITTRVY